MAEIIWQGVGRIWGLVVNYNKTVGVRNRFLYVSPQFRRLQFLIETYLRMWRLFWRLSQSFSSYILSDLIPFKVTSDNKCFLVLGQFQSLKFERTSRIILINQRRMKNNIAINRMRSNLHLIYLGYAFWRCKR